MQRCVALVVLCCEEGVWGGGGEEGEEEGEEGGEVGGSGCEHELGVGLACSYLVRVWGEE